MTILQRIRSDLDRGLLEHRAKVLLEVIRQRIGELTLGDLREILASKLGQGLAALKLIDLTGGTGEAKPALPGATTGKQGKAAKSKAKAGKARKATSTRGKAKATTAKTGTFGAELLEKVWQTLHAAGVPMTSGELRAALGGSKATMYRAVSELVRAGKLATAGKPARYSAKAAAEAARAEAAAAAPANAGTPEAAKKATKKSAGKKAAKKAAGEQAAKKAGGKKAGKKAGAKKAGKKVGKQAGAKRSAKAESANTAIGNGASAEVSARTVEGRAQFDEKLVAALRTAADWVGATRLREAIGGTDNQVRIALHRLIAEGKVARRGARNSTEYRLGG